MFSVGALMYHLLLECRLGSKTFQNLADRTKAEDIIIEERKKPISFPESIRDIVDFDETILKVLKKSLQQDLDQFDFNLQTEFIQALNGEIEIEDVDTVQKKVRWRMKKKNSKAKGKGFDAIAMMRKN